MAIRPYSVTSAATRTLCCGFLELLPDAFGLSPDGVAGTAANAESRPECSNTDYVVPHSYYCQPLRRGGGERSKSGAQSGERVRLYVRVFVWSAPTDPEALRALGSFSSKGRAGVLRQRLAEQQQE